METQQLTPENTKLEIVTTIRRRLGNPADRHEYHIDRRGTLNKTELRALSDRMALGFNPGDTSTDIRERILTDIGYDRPRGDAWGSLPKAALLAIANDEDLWT